MKKVLYLLTLTTLLLFVSCREKSEDYDLIGKKGIIEYPEIKANVYYQTETKLHWETVHKNGSRATGSEDLYYKRLSDELHFLNWIEKDGSTISQIINTKTREVKTFWSFHDESSSRGNRSSMFLDGKFSFDK